MCQDATGTSSSSAPCGAEGPVRVLFVVGMARSGSTLLTMLLNEVEGVFGLGEAHVYWDLEGSGRRCGCGRDLDRCPVWGELRRAHEEQGVDVAEMRRAFHDFVRPRPGSLLRRLWARHGRAGKARAALYAETMAATYRWLSERSGAGLLVDSSKLPAAAEVTAAARGAEVGVVHLIRDPRAVAHSLGRRRLREGRRRPARGEHLRYLGAVLRATLDWTLRNAYVVLRLRGLSGRYARLRFEDLTRDPSGAIAPVLEMAGSSAAEGPIADHAFDAGENHILTGDESRFGRGRIAIEPQEAWREEMPAYAKIGRAHV